MKRVSEVKGSEGKCRQISLFYEHLSNCRGNYASAHKI